EDVRVRQRRHRACLALEAGPRFGVTREIGREDLDCDLAAKSLVACSVDLSHSARTEKRDHFVGAETATRLERARKRSRSRWLWRISLVDQADRGGVDEASGRLVSLEQRFDFLSERSIAGTRLGEIGTAVLRGLLDRRVKELLHPLPALGRRRRLHALP